MTWIAAHIVDIVLILVIAMIVALIVINAARKRKGGVSSCGCNCSGCAMSGQCGSKHNN
jgi:hypothetical protein